MSKLQPSSKSDTPTFNLPSFILYASRPFSILLLLIATYTIYFSWYTINRHNTLYSYAADLSLIDQPMWNTVLGPGGFMEQTWGDRQQPRLAEHFEPILIPLALLFFLWDNVRILLIAQSLALALGALPVFWIAKAQLSIINYQLPFSNNHSPRQESILYPPSSSFHLPSWSALAFAIAYLLFPHLQAANVADFHADPFIVAPLLFAFWYATQQRWRWFWFWAILAMLTKENLPTLTAMLGLYLINYQLSITNYQLSISKLPWTTLWSQGRQSSQPRPPTSSLLSSLLHPFTLVLISIAWFLIATFLIVAPLAHYYFGVDGPIYLASRFSGGLVTLSELLQDPARWRYLEGLFAAAGFLPLLAPELLILGLPVLAANLLSNFPGQYSGEQHYSAPLVVPFILAAIYGTRRLMNITSLHEVNKQPLKQTVLILACLWLLSWSLGYHSLHGWTPLSIRTETNLMRPAALQLPEFLPYIPADAVVSSSPAIHPHLAHRRVNYLFPIIQEADYLLVDVTDISGVHPNDVRTQLLDLLNGDWRLLKAAHGLLLAQKSHQPLDASSPQLPEAFFNFARATSSPAYPTALSFGDDQVRLLGYDIRDDPDNGVSFRFYWQARQALPKDFKLWPLFYDDLGQILSDPTQIPQIATVWYSPDAWSPGEIVVTETLPQTLPYTFHLGIAVGSADSFSDPNQRLPISLASTKSIPLYSGHWAQLASFQRQGPFLTHLPPISTLKPLRPIQAQFGSAIQLSGFWLDDVPSQTGATLPLLLRWVATQPLQTDFTVFIHLLAPDGSLVAQNDALPTWLTSQPTSQWPLQQPILDRHILSLPVHLPPATYTLQLGLYNPQTLERLTLSDGSDALLLLQIQLPSRKLTFSD